MTAGVCLNCGARKIGAFTPCHSCGYQPSTDEDFTRHLLATDHHRSKDELDTIAEAVRHGEPVEFPQTELDTYWVTSAEVADGERQAMMLSMGCGLLLLTIVIGVVLTALL
jgi:hypothetical protein